MFSRSIIEAHMGDDEKDPKECWLVNYDHLDDEKVEVIGPHWADVEYAKTGAIKFRMYDDDGNLYYSGVMTQECYENDPFRPIDDYGTPNAGAVRLDYFNEQGEWETI